MTTLRAKGDGRYVSNLQPIKGVFFNPVSSSLPNKTFFKHLRTSIDGFILEVLRGDMGSWLYLQGESFHRYYPPHQYGEIRDGKILKVLPCFLIWGKMGVSAPPSLIPPTNSFISSLSCGQGPDGPQCYGLSKTWGPDLPRAQLRKKKQRQILIPISFSLVQDSKYSSFV